MNTERLAYLQKQYSTGSLTNDECQELRIAANDPDNEGAFQDVAEMLWQSEEDVTSLEQPEFKEVYQYIIKNPQTRRSYKLWPRVAAAVFILFTIGASISFYANQSKDATTQTLIYANDVVPGIQGATLILANGKKIRLTDAVNGELGNEAGVSITKTATGQLIFEIIESGTDTDKKHILSTAKGEIYQLRLADGSLVWSNVASSLTYDANLTKHGKRRVELDGEGYFAIAKDKTHPFIAGSVPGRFAKDVSGMPRNVSFANKQNLIVHRY